MSLVPSRKALSTMLFLVVLGVLGRLAPHLPNFSTVGGVSLFAGARLGGWRAPALPLLIMAITAPILGRQQDFVPFDSVTPFVYGSFLIHVWIGSRLRGRPGPWRIGGAALIGSLQFFLITNLGMWASGISFYPPTPEGLMACYAGALPYFGRTLISDLLVCGILFGWQPFRRRVFPIRMTPAARSTSA